MKEIKKDEIEDVSGGVVRLPGQDLPGPFPGPGWPNPCPVPQPDDTLLL